MIIIGSTRDCRDTTVSTIEIVLHILYAFHLRCPSLLLQNINGQELSNMLTANLRDINRERESTLTFSVLICGHNLCCTHWRDQYVDKTLRSLHVVRGKESEFVVVTFWLINWGSLGTRNLCDTTTSLDVHLTIETFCDILVLWLDRLVALFKHNEKHD